MDSPDRMQGYERPADHAQPSSRHRNTSGFFLKDRISGTIEHKNGITCPVTLLDRRAPRAAEQGNRRSSPDPYFTYSPVVSSRVKQGWIGIIIK